MLTDEQFARGFMVLCETYGKTPSPTLTTIYRDVLAPQFTEDDWQRAVKTVIATRVYPTLPLPAELIQAVRGTPKDAQVELDHRSRLACALAFEAMTRLGVYESVEFDDPTIARTIRSAWGSWQAFGNDEADAQWVERRFMETYKALDGKTSTSERLPGLHEISAVAHGKREVKTHLIGSGPDGRYVERKALAQIVAPDENCQSALKNPASVVKEMK